MVKYFADIAAEASNYNTKVALIIGPNKSSVYSEYLPDSIHPSSKRYISYFTDQLSKISNLIVYDPTYDLIEKKNSEGTLYWRTDTHWNQKGSFIAFQGFLNLMDIDVPEVTFEPGAPHKGDLVEIASLHDFPVKYGDNWDTKWKKIPSLKSTLLPRKSWTSFAKTEIKKNNEPISNKVIWVVGDSFLSSLKPYLNSTFKEVRYINKLHRKLHLLPRYLRDELEKPDYILIVKVERKF